MNPWFYIALWAINLVSIGLSTASIVRKWREDHIPAPNLCPHCGTIPGLRRVGENRNLFVCTCTECGYTPAKNGEARRTVRGAVKVWNEGTKHGD